MCEPTTIGLAVAAAGTLIKANAQAEAGAAAKRQMYTSAAFADEAAADAVKRGTLRDLQVALRGSQVMSEQRVAQSGSGVDVNTGGSLQTQRGTAAVSEVDRATVRRNAALAAYGLRMKSQSLRQSGEYGEREGNDAALGTFLSGAGSVASKGMALSSDLKSPTSEDFSYGGGPFADEAD